MNEKTPPFGERELDRALNTLIRIVREGLCHGHFEYSIRCEVAGSNKRRLIIVAGKSYAFSIPAGDLED